MCWKIKDTQREGKWEKYTGPRTRGEVDHMEADVLSGLPNFLSWVCHVGDVCSARRCFHLSAVHSSFFFFLLNSYRKLEKKTKKQTKAAILQPLPASPLAYWEHDLSLDRLQEIVQLSWYVPLPKSFSSCPDGLRRTTAVSHWQGFNPYCASQCNLNTWACVSGFWFICINHLKFPKTYQFKPFKTTYVH